MMGGTTMEPPLVAQFDYSDEMARRHAIELVHRQYGFLGFGVIVLGVVLALTLVRDSRSFGAGLAVGVVGATALLVGAAYSSVLRAVRAAREVPDRRVTVYLEESGIRFENWAGHSVCRWEGVTALIESASYTTLVLGRAGRGSAPIPRAAMSVEFHARLVERVKAAGGRLVV